MEILGGDRVHFPVSFVCASVWLVKLRKRTVTLQNGCESNGSNLYAAVKKSVLR